MVPREIRAVCPLKGEYPTNTMQRRKGEIREKKYLAAILYPEAFTLTSHG
jgi:hypothetical protein